MRLKTGSAFGSSELSQMSAIQSLTTPAGALTVANTCLAAGSLAWIYRTRTDLMKEIEATKDHIGQLDDFVKQIDPKVIPRLQHAVVEISQHLGGIAQRAQDLGDQLEEEEARLSLLEANLEKIGAYLEERDGTDLDLEIYTPVVRKRPVKKARPVRDAEDLQRPKSVVRDAEEAPRPSGTLRVKTKTPPKPLPLPADLPNDEDDIDAIAAQASRVPA